MLGSVSGSSSSSFDFSILTQLELARDREPLTQMQTKQSSNKLKLSAMQSLNSQIVSLNSSISTLNTSSTYASKSTVSSNTGVATITANANSAAGTYKLTNVTQLATSTKMTTSSTNAGGGLGGSISPTATLINAGFGITPSNGGDGKGSFTIDGITIEYDVETDKLEDSSDTEHSIVDRINNAMAGAGKNITADYDETTDKFTLVRTGSTDTISISSGADKGNLLSALNLTSATQDTSGGNNTVTSSIHLKTVKADEVLTSAKSNFGVSITAGSFTINGTTLNIGSTDTLNSVLEKINNSSAGVSASYDRTTDKLVLNSKTTGTTSIMVGATSDTSNFLSAAFIKNGVATEETGKNAVFQIEGINNGNPITRNSNSISDLIDGVTIQLKSTYNTGTTTETPISLSISQDTSTAYNAISSFVSNFNSLVSNLKIKTAPADVENDTVTTESGVLHGDAFFTGMRSELQLQATNLVNGITGNYNSLSSIGITLNESGELSIDSSKLNSALSSNMSDVQQIFTNSSYGIASTMSTYLTGITDSSTGSLTKSIEYFTETSNNLDSQIEKFEEYLTKREEYYTQKYADIQATYDALLSQSTSVMFQLSNISSVSLFSK
ncbi:MAG: flagellar filament capping protein FliD [Candidatus Eremiobacterota bacterium]